MKYCRVNQSPDPRGSEPGPDLEDQKFEFSNGTITITAYILKLTDFFRYQIAVKIIFYLGTPINFLILLLAISVPYQVP